MSFSQPLSPFHPIFSPFRLRRGRERAVEVELSCPAEENHHVSLLPLLQHGGSSQHLLFFDPQQPHSIFLEGIPFLHASQAPPPEAEGLCPVSNRFLSAPFPREGSQLLGFPAL